MKGLSKEIEDKLAFTKMSFGITVTDFINVEHQRKLMNVAKIMKAQDDPIKRNVVWNLLKSM